MHSTEALPLPSRPSVEQYRKLAKDLATAVKSGRDEAVRSFLAGWFEKLWKTNDDVPWSAESPRYIAEYSDRLTRYFNGGWTPKDVPPPRRTLAHAQFVIARVHGFARWGDLVRHIETLAQDSAEARFERAVDAVVTGDIDALQRLLREHPELARARSSRGHGCTLLHYVSANGVEGYRQKTPPNIVAITKMLLEAGADVNATAACYGTEDDTLGLTATSMHPHNAGVMIPLLETLVVAGADMNRDGGWGIIRACLANGQPDAARWLADHGAVPDLADALGIGRLDLVQSFLSHDGTLKNGATAAQLEEGIRNASWYGEIAAIRYVLDGGFDAGRRFVDGATALHHASYDGNAELVALLLERGAPVTVRDTEHDGTPLEWALYARSERQKRRGDATSHDRVIALLETASGNPPPGA